MAGKSATLASSFRELALSPDDIATLMLEDDDELIVCTEPFPTDALTCGNRRSLTAYKRVDKKIRPVTGVVPVDQQVTRHRPSEEELFADQVPLTPHPPEFTPSERLTRDRLMAMSINKDGYLLPEEEKLFAHILRLNDTSLAFEESQRGTLKESYFSPYIYVTIPHKAWEYRNIPIPPGIHDKVLSLLREKIKAGVYE
ncbi:uncharacterized protein SCHCODRAFT_02490672, partial [Schizophyllum commune H4-8]|uniref:uncharacterized protein n=1 Tax=Schizophyllum commune (strain H4-8 / FGSC 9210) TaxID=578458 RepID=UPI002160A312